MRIGKLEIRIIKDDSELGFRETKKIVKDFDSLLADIGFTSPNYEVVLDPKQGSGFMPEDQPTKEVINSLPPKVYNKFLDRLTEITKSLSENYTIDRASFYK